MLQQNSGTSANSFFLTLRPPSGAHPAAPGAARRALLRLDRPALPSNATQRNALGAPPRRNRQRRQWARHVSQDLTMAERYSLYVGINFMNLTI